MPYDESWSDEWERREEIRKELEPSEDAITIEEIENADFDCY